MTFAVCSEWVIIGQCPPSPGRRNPVCRTPVDGRGHRRRVVGQRPVRPGESDRRREVVGDWGRAAGAALLVGALARAVVINVMAALDNRRTSSDQVPCADP
jgi:hypothetical protein